MAGKPPAARPREFVGVDWGPFEQQLAARNARIRKWALRAEIGILSLGAVALVAAVPATIKSVAIAAGHAIEELASSSAAIGEGGAR